MAVKHNGCLLNFAASKIWRGPSEILYTRGQEQEKEGSPVPIWLRCPPICLKQVNLTIYFVLQYLSHGSGNSLRTELPLVFIYLISSLAMSSPPMPSRVTSDRRHGLPLVQGLGSRLFPSHLVHRLIHNSIQLPEVPVGLIGQK